MYAAKENGRNNFLFHTAEMKTQSIERLMLENSLRRATRAQRAVAALPTQAEPQAGDISGVEAWLRWQHPEFGLLLPIISFRSPRRPI